MKKQRLISALTSLAAVFSIISPTLKNSSVQANAAASPERPVVVVSMGDSYSSGEGIEPFYGQFKSNGSSVDWDERAEKYDWLAHRSTHSWPSLLEIPGIKGTMADYKVTGENTNWTDICRWYFVASSGAVTDDFIGRQEKDTKKDTLASVVKHSLPPQYDVFDTVAANGDVVDYVTMSIGGNDVGFTSVIAARALSSFKVEAGTTWLVAQFNDIWSNWDTKYGKDIKNAYLGAYRRAGKQAYILIAGYPQLLYQNISGYNLAEIDTVMIQHNITIFNNKLKQLVEECNEECGTDHFRFIDVEDEFSGHAAYSGKYNYSSDAENSEPDYNGPWINGFDFIANSEDLIHGIHKAGNYFSSYSIHPNKRGAEAYARCVNKEIAAIEKEKQDRRDKLDESAEGYKWAVYPEVNVDDIIVGDSFMTNDYTFGSGSKSSPLVYMKRTASSWLILKKDYYGLIDYNGKTAVPTAFDGFNGSSTNMHGYDEFIAVYDTESGDTIALSKGSGKNEHYSLRKVENAYGNLGTGSTVTTYFKLAYNNKLYSFNGHEGFIELSGGDVSYIVQEVIGLDPESASSLKDASVNFDFFLCDTDGNELTPRYSYAYSNGSGCVNSKVYTTCALSNDKKHWDIYDMDGNKLASDIAPFEFNEYYDLWWASPLYMSNSNKLSNCYGFAVPFCATEGYLAVNDGNGKYYYLNLKDQRRIEGDFEDIRPVHNGKAWVKCDGYWGVIELEKSEDAEDVFAELPEKFIFASGAGGWGTELTINSDGSFTGEYHDSELGITGEGYKNGTVYICNFSGKFKDVEKIDDYTYSIKLDYLETEGTQGEEYIEDEIRYIYSEPYGMSRSEEFQLFLPGKPLDDMPEDFISWLSIRGSAIDSDVLAENAYGIYNPGYPAAFIGIS